MDISAFLDASDDLFTGDPGRTGPRDPAHAALCERVAGMTTANEVAVHAFLQGRLSFLGIPAVIEEVLGELPAEPVRAFEVGIVVTVVNGKGVLARVAAALAVLVANVDDDVLCGRHGHIRAGEGDVDRPVQDRGRCREVIEYLEQCRARPGNSVVGEAV